MRPRRQCRALLEGFALVFDLPAGRGERAVANVRLDSGAHIWGVAYEISVAQAAWLDRTEGVHRGSYTRIPVMLRPEPGGALPAFTYHSGRGVPGRCQGGCQKKTGQGLSELHGAPAYTGLGPGQIR